MIFPTPAAAFSSYHCVNPQIRMQARKEKILSPSQHSASSFCCLVCIAGNIPVSLCFVLLSPFLAFLSLTTSQSLRLRLMTLDSSVLPPSLTYYCSHFPFAPLLPYSITNSPTHPGPKPPAYSSIPFLCLILPLHPHSRAFAPAAARRRQRRDCRRLVTASSTGAAGRPWGVAAEKEVACAAHARRCVGGGPAGSLACWVTAVGFIA